MARKNQTDYPTAWGDKKVSVIVHNGPALYAPIVQGSPPTGGDVVTATELGLKSIDWAQGAIRRGVLLGQRESD
jgi:hypothetical protein